MIQHAYYDCLEKRISDSELITRDVCKEDRFLFQKNVDCDGAERRLRISIFVCTIYTVCSESFISEIFQKLTSSYFTIICTILPIIVAYMYFWSQRKVQMDMMGKFGELFGKRIKKKKVFGNALSYK